MKITKKNSKILEKNILKKLKIKNKLKFWRSIFEKKNENVGKENHFEKKMKIL
mgnify:CR=1 FL=1